MVAQRYQLPPRGGEKGYTLLSEAIVLNDFVLSLELRVDSTAMKLHLGGSRASRFSSCDRDNLRTYAMMELKATERDAELKMSNDHPLLVL